LSWPLTLPKTKLSWSVSVMLEKWTAVRTDILDAILLGCCMEGDIEALEPRVGSDGKLNEVENVSVDQTLGRQV
jgi:hypothetical protein